MGNKSRFYIAESNIKAFFKESVRKVYSYEQLGEILEQKRNQWNLPITMNTEKFIEKITSSNTLKKEEFFFSGSLSNKIRYVDSASSIFQLAVSLINKSYLSHFTAAFIHGLTNQIPKTIYITFEQSKKNQIERQLEQERIDIAFSKAQRKSETIAIYEDYTLVIHNGMYSHRAGIYVLDDISVTNIERTLIDITVRPAYAGGVDSVLDIYKHSSNIISINKLIAILEKINFIYPYHQAIGFYLERAGIATSRLNDLMKKPKPYRFYLNYEMKEMEFDKTWNIFSPKGI
ncbi:MAG: hypothetical protein IPK08_10685 [Bacteroidetes bacterium]|nr:hypothetical protein [Bacteroidota bacterium]